MNILCNIISPDNYNDNYDCCDDYVVDSNINQSVHINSYRCRYTPPPRPYMANGAKRANELITKAHEAERAGRPIWDRNIGQGYKQTFRQLQDLYEIFGY